MELAEYERLRRTSGDRWDWARMIALWLSLLLAMIIPSLVGAIIASVALNLGVFFGWLIAEALWDRQWRNIMRRLHPGSMP